MAVAEPCRECGVSDALGRHAGNCARALEMGLPRLADGEEPIDPIEETVYDTEPELEGEVAVEEIAEPDPLLNVARRRGAVIDLPDKRISELWMAYTTASGNAANAFDAVVFSSELEALRYAVSQSWRVMALELGRSLLDQANA
jgi:hypothetical protein